MKGEKKKKKKMKMKMKMKKKEDEEVKGEIEEKEEVSNVKEITKENNTSSENFFCLEIVESDYLILGKCANHSEDLPNR